MLNQGAVTVEYHTQLKGSLSNRETVKEIRNQTSFHATLIISILNIMVRKKILTSDVDWRIISLQIVRNRTLRIRKIFGTQKSIKVVRTDIWKWIRYWTTVQNKVSAKRYTPL